MTNPAEPSSDHIRDAARTALMHLDLIRAVYRASYENEDGPLCNQHRHDELGYAMTIAALDGAQRGFQAIIDGMTLPAAFNDLVEQVHESHPEVYKQLGLDKLAEPAFDVDSYVN